MFKYIRKKIGNSKSFILICILLVVLLIVTGIVIPLHLAFEEIPYKMLWAIGTTIFAAYQFFDRKIEKEETEKRHKKELVKVTVEANAKFFVALLERAAWAATSGSIQNAMMLVTLTRTYFNNMTHEFSPDEKSKLQPVAHLLDALESFPETDSIRLAASISAAKQCLEYSFTVINEITSEK